MQRDSMTQHKILRQSIGDIISGVARTSAQHGHTTFLRNSARSAEVFRGVCGMLFQKIFGI